MGARKTQLNESNVTNAHHKEEVFFISYSAPLNNLFRNPIVSSL